MAFQSYIPGVLRRRKINVRRNAKRCRFRRTIAGGNAGRNGGGSWHRKHSADSFLQFYFADFLRRVSSTVCTLEVSRPPERARAKDSRENHWSRFGCDERGRGFERRTQTFSAATSGSPRWMQCPREVSADGSSADETRADQTRADQTRADRAKADRGKCRGA